MMPAAGTGSEIHVLPMAEGHLQRVSEIERDRFSMPWSKQGFLDALHLDNVLFYTALADGEVAGYCGMYCALDEGEITNVAVAREFEGKGIGSRLISRLLEASRVSGIRSVVLEVRVSNERAIRLYEHHGFAACGIRKGFYQAPSEDACVMVHSQ